MRNNMGEQYNAYWRKETLELYEKHHKEEEGKGAFINRIIQKHFKKKVKKRVQ